VRRVILSLRWLALHMLAVVLVAVCLRLGWWQWDRAGEGSARSLGYALEWPGFAAFVVLVWGYLVRDALRTHRNGGRIAGPARDQRVPDTDGARDDAEAELMPPDPALTAARAEAVHEQNDELAAYNDYLARLNAADCAPDIRAPDARRNPL